MNNSKKIKWLCTEFGSLSTSELYKILQLRNAVFIVEQNCPYQDMDNKDLECFHLCGWDGDILTAYTRLLPAGISFNEVSIGRVVTEPSKRKEGIGKALMEISIAKCYEIFGKQSIRIGAQLYLKKFYEAFGFEQSSDIYLEDGINHIEMILIIK